jgi:hypothetical protein
MLLVSVTRKAAVDDNVIALRQNKTVLVAQAVGKAADEAEQPFATRFDVSAVLDVFVGPEAGCCLVITFVEQRVEGFEYERLVLFWGVVLDMRLVLAVKASSHHRRGWCRP